MLLLVCTAAAVWRSACATTTTIEEDGEVSASAGVGGGVFGVSCSLDGDLLVVGAKQDTSQGGGGFVAVFKTSDGGASWVEQDLLVPTGNLAGDLAGSGVAISGSLLVVGAPGAGSGGTAYFYRTSDGGATWSEETSKAPAGLASGASFGVSTALDGSMAVVSAAFDDVGATNDGSAFVYTTSDGGVSWDEREQLTASDASAENFFGSAIGVSESAGLIVVGALGHTSFAGAAYVFRTLDSGVTWTETDIVTGTAGSFFGGTIAISGTVMLVGAYSASGNKGEAYAYTTSDGGASWTFADTLAASDGAGSDYFAQSVAMDGDYAIIGASGKDSSTGAGYVFSTADGGTTWSEVSKITASVNAFADTLGSSAAIDDGLVVIGAPGSNGFVTDSGKVFHVRVATAGAGGDPVFVDFAGHRFLAGNKPNTVLPLFAFGRDQVLVQTGTVRGVEDGFFLVAVTLERAGGGSAAIEAVPGEWQTTITGDAAVTDGMAHGDSGLVVLSVANGEAIVAVKPHVLSDTFSFLNIKVLFASDALKAGCTGMLCDEVHRA